jgi:hypothetical protein
MSPELPLTSSQDWQPRRAPALQGRNREPIEPT